ncbi:MAG: hypothetical protein ACK5MV_08095 [Aminipila sp.]
MNCTHSIDCIDSGTENCPCYLAATGDCLVCSRLQGKEYCDCLWKGVCIYNEFVQNNHKVNNPRKDFTARIVSKEKFSDDLYSMTLEVGRGFALKAAVPGTYVFLQPLSHENYYHTPISVMRVDAEKGFITLLIKSISAKTKAICSEEEKVIVRGVYRGGLRGISNIMGRFSRIVPESKVLIITKGVGFAPAVNFTDWAGQASEIDIVIDTDKICDAVVNKYLSTTLVQNVSMQSLQDTLYTSLKSKIESGNYTVVAVLASDFYIEEIRKIVSCLSKSTAFVCSNNANICCGEGICGACSCTDAHGNTYKRCKCL